MLEAAIQRARNATDEELLNLGIVPPGDDPDLRQDRIDFFLNLACWQIAMFFRFSVPTRIAEAEPHLRFLLDEFNKVHQGTKLDFLPMLYLASSIQKMPGKQKEAADLFRRAFDF